MVSEGSMTDFYARGSRVQGTVNLQSLHFPREVIIVEII
jgi:hypothetical protein